VHQSVNRDTPSAAKGSAGQAALSDRRPLATYAATTSSYRALAWGVP